MTTPKRRGAIRVSVAVPFQICDIPCPTAVLPTGVLARPDASPEACRRAAVAWLLQSARVCPAEVDRIAEFFR